MAHIIDVEFMEIAEGESPDAFLVTFDVIYPGETWCRSLVRLTPTAAAGSEREMIGRARDALLQILELEGSPASADIRLSAEGTVILELGHVA